MNVLYLIKKKIVATDYKQYSRAWSQKGVSGF